VSSGTSSPAGKSAHSVAAREDPFAGRWFLRLWSADARLPGSDSPTVVAELSLTARGPVPERQVVIIGRRGYLRGQVYSGHLGLDSVPAGPGPLSPDVLALGKAPDTLSLAVMGTRPIGRGQSFARSGIALFGLADGDSVAGYWQWAEDTSGVRGHFVLRRP
jgi:hypothetical protein